TKPGLGKVRALRIKKGCASILTQPLKRYNFNSYRSLPTIRTMPGNRVKISRRWRNSLTKQSIFSIESEE
ncbi:hypothetical protein, partial [uncultured Bacteroides sp.]|uniref:hypothetical protein n=1 Tax=uncultured Bacteroides sp. TaxID=162156 RepID=UPI0032B243EB